MKAFGKWVEKLFKTEGEEDFSLNTQAKYKKGWKAALEWIYKEAKQLEKQPESPMDAYDLIKQELEE